MNRTNLLVTSTVVAFVAATGVSMAQQERSAPAPGVHKQAPSGQVPSGRAPSGQAPSGQAPSGREAPQNRSRETTAQAPREDRQNRPSGRNLEQERGKTGQSLRSERNEQNRAIGQAPREDRLNRAPE